MNNNYSDILCLSRQIYLKTMKFSFDVALCLPDKLYIACSGGMDSMVFRHFLLQSNRDVVCLYFNHGTPFGDISEKFLRAVIGDNLIVGRICRSKPKGVCREQFWRDCRYDFFDGFIDRDIVTCHHLDDQIETFLQGVSHGRTDRFIPLVRGEGICGRPRYMRPFLNVPKTHIVNYANRHAIKYICDPSNLDLSYTRNRIRHTIIPQMLKVNPGFYKSFLNLSTKSY